MKLLYLAPVNIHEKKIDGVAKKIFNQTTEFSKFFDVYMMSYRRNDIAIYHGQKRQEIDSSRIHRRYSLYDEVNRLAEKEKFDCIYIRYSRSERNLICLLNKLYSYGAKIISEIPTYPYNGGMFENPRKIAIAAADSVYRLRLKKYIQRIVTYSDDDFIFGIPTIRTINGINFDNEKIANHKTDSDSINLISVATNYECHGFDRIIEGMDKYYAAGGTTEIRFKIVGDGPAILDYKKQISQSPYLGGRVELTGFQTGDALQALYDEADIAVNSLALYRIGLKKESTLKSKEYIAKGFPILSSTEIDGFDLEGNRKYVHLVSDCGFYIKAEEIIDFYHRIYDGNDVNKVAHEIREAGRKICDMSITMKPVIDFFLDTNNQ